MRIDLIKYQALGNDYLVVDLPAALDEIVRLLPTLCDRNRGLGSDGLLAFDPVTPAWQWDMDRIRARSYTDNVVELMSGKLRRLSVPTQEALKQLACLGNVAEIATLTLVY